MYIVQFISFIFIFFCVFRIGRWVRMRRMNVYISWWTKIGWDSVLTIFDFLFSVFSVYYVCKCRFFLLCQMVYSLIYLLLVAVAWLILRKYVRVKRYFHQFFLWILRFGGVPPFSFIYVWFSLNHFQDCNNRIRCNRERKFMCTIEYQSSHFPFFVILSLFTIKASSDFLFLRVTRATSILYIVHCTVYYTVAVVVVVVHFLQHCTLHMYAHNVRWKHESIFLPWTLCICILYSVFMYFCGRAYPFGLRLPFFWLVIWIDFNVYAEFMNFVFKYSYYQHLIMKIQIYRVACIMMYNLYRHFYIDGALFIIVIILFSISFIHHFTSIVRYCVHLAPTPFQPVSSISSQMVYKRKTRK